MMLLLLFFPVAVGGWERIRKFPRLGYPLSERIIGLGLLLLLRNWEPFHLLVSLWITGISFRDYVWGGFWSRIEEQGSVVLILEGVIRILSTQQGRDPRLLVGDEKFSIFSRETSLTSFHQKCLISRQIAEFIELLLLRGGSRVIDLIWFSSRNKLWCFLHRGRRKSVGIFGRDWLWFITCLGQVKSSLIHGILLGQVRHVVMTGDNVSTVLKGS